MKITAKSAFVAGTLLFILLLTSIILLLSFSTASASTESQLINEITTNETIVITDHYEVYGNLKDISEKQFENLVQNGENKVYLHYSTDRSINLYYDALLCVKTDEKIHSFEFKEAERSDAEFLALAIKSFINIHSDRIAKLQAGKLHKAATASAVPTTFINCVVDKEYTERFSDKGYVVSHIAVSRYDALTDSQLFIVTVNSSFVPGSVARANDDKTYKAYQSKAGYVHMTAEQAFDKNDEPYYGIRYGGEVYKKDYWPVNNPGTVTISSSVKAGLTMGHSFKNGFSLDGISVSSDRNTGLNISYGYTKSYTMQEPALSVQPSSSNLAEIQWSFKYETKRAEAYNLQTNYMFELSDIKNSMCKGDFRLKLDYRFDVRNGGLPIKTSYYNRDLFVQADAYKSIRLFSNGMI